MEPESVGVLIVDDEPAICSLICTGLKSRGVRCVTCTDPVEARRLLGCEQFFVMVADVTMATVSGLDLLAYARQHAPQCKVILITGFSSTESLAEALSLGAYEYFRKPFEMARLLDAIARAGVSDPASCELSIRAARAIELEDQMKHVALESIRALARAVEAKDPYTRRHSEQVTHYATHLAGHLALPTETVESIRAAALLHDIGKIGIPDTILTKTGPLTEEEFEHVRHHPALGAEILEHISRFADESRIVRHHHENWDGSGYPDGLAGTDIPLGARILNVADAIDAMLMRRTYKEAYSVEKMLNEMERCSGGQFDPDIAAAAHQWCRAHRKKLIQPGAAA